MWGRAMSGGKARCCTLGGVPARQCGGWDERRVEKRIQIDGFFSHLEVLDTAFLDGITFVRWVGQPANLVPLRFGIWLGRDWRWLLSQTVSRAVDRSFRLVQKAIFLMTSSGFTICGSLVPTEHAG